MSGSPTATVKSADVPAAPKELRESGVTSVGGSTVAVDEKSKPATAPIQSDGDEAAEQLPTGLRLYIIMAALMLTVFLAALDNTIIAPALPIISNDYGTTSDVAFYISSYFMTSTALQPLYGRFYRLNLKWTFLASIVIFEVGSLICALAQESKTFIVGRAIAGVGTAGGYLGVMTILAASVPLERKAFWAGQVGAFYGLGAVVGPLIGGAFTTRVSWRWINLPIGGVTVAIIVLFFKPPSRTLNDGKTWTRRLLEIDWVGTAILLGVMVCILLALQNGGIKQPWDDSEVFGLIISFGLLNIALAGWELYRQDNGILPPRLLKQRTILWASITNFTIGAGYFTVLSFLPIYYQIRGSSAIRSGVQTLPLICGVILSAIVSGALVPVIGYTPPLLLFGMPLFAIGSGILILFDENTSQAMWVGISFAIGVGSGTVWQAPFISAQTVTSFSSALDTEQAAAITLFFQIYGGAILFALSQAIFQNKYAQGVITVPGLENALGIAVAGETAFRQLVPPALLPAVERVAINAVQYGFIPPTAILALGFFTSFGIEWRSLKPAKPADGEAVEEAAATAK